MIRIDARPSAKRAGALPLAWAGPASAAATDAQALLPSAPAWWAVWLAMIVLAVLCVGLLLRQRHLMKTLRDARRDAQGLTDLLDVWQWRTGADHRIAHLRPPQGAPASAWSTPGHTMALWDCFRCDDAAALRACLDAHAPLADLRVQWPAADGVAAEGRLRGTALTDTQGRFAGYLGTLRLVPAEPAAHAAHAALQNGTSNGGAADSERESFTYTVSHDLRAPIRVVEGFTKILKEDYGRVLDRIGNDHLDRVLGAAARMNSMIDALLALSQLSTQPLASQPVNLSQLAGYIADDLRRQAPERHVKIDIQPGLMVLGDPTLLRVVLENLLGNAWKYTGKCREPQIWFGRDAQQADHTFTVRDNGAGFDMRFADRLFGVFQRLHSANDFQGTGVGLASVRRIVRRHGGEIWAESEVDRGASFHFSLGPRGPGH